MTRGNGPYERQSKKYVLPNLPYLFIFWIVDKLGQAFRFSIRENVGKQLIDAINELATLHRDPLPSVQQTTDISKKKRRLAAA